jgi:beta-D-xylosidase 4
VKKNSKAFKAAGCYLSGHEGDFIQSWCYRRPLPTPTPPPLPTPAAAAPYPKTRPCDGDPLRGSITCDPTAEIENRLDDLISKIPVDDAPRLFSDGTRVYQVGVPKLGIPPYNWWSEALHGVSRCPYQKSTPSAHAGSCCVELKDGSKKCPTSFPAGITTGCSFNKSLMHSIGTAIGDEARAASNAGIAGLTFWSVGSQYFAHIHRIISPHVCPTRTPNVNLFR